MIQNTGMKEDKHDTKFKNKREREYDLEQRNTRKKMSHRNSR